MGVGVIPVSVPAYDGTSRVEEEWASRRLSMGVTTIAEAVCGSGGGSHAGPSSLPPGIAPVSVPCEEGSPWTVGSWFREVKRERKLLRDLA